MTDKNPQLEQPQSLITPEKIQVKHLSTIAKVMLELQKLNESNER